MKNTVVFGISFVLFIIAIGVFYRLLIAREQMKVTSWWRSFRRNIEVGGKANSLHMVGLAWDVIPVTATNEKKLRGMGLVVVNEGDHLHAQVKI